MKSIVALLFLVILQQGAFMSIYQDQSFLQRSSAPEIEGYEFVQGLDSYGNDISNEGTKIKHLVDFCNSRPDCVGFNTNGWVKKQLLPRSSWDRFSNDPNEGTYIKKASTELDGYEFVQGLDSNGNDIANKGTNLQTLKQFCDSRSDCLGFNTNGWVKKQWLPRSSWLRFSNDPEDGTYIKKAAPTATELAGYEFVQGLDSDGNDIANKGTNLETLRQFCESRSDCLGFNTNGWVKKQWRPRSNWVRFSSDAREGTYIKKANTLDGYQFIQGMDSDGNDIANKGTNLQTLKQFCDSRSDCLGFNTNGWVKKDFKSHNLWDRFSNNPRDGTYVKQPAQAAALQGYYFIQGLDSDGNDIANKGTNLQTLKQFCDSRSDCLGFNTNGWVKKQWRPRTNWVRFSSNPNAGTYVKLPPNTSSLMQLAMGTSAKNNNH